MNWNQPIEYNSFSQECPCDVIILAAGFEERSFHFISHSTFKRSAYCILIKFEYDVNENAKVLKKFEDRIINLFEEDHIRWVPLNQNKAQNFDKDLKKEILKLPREAIDIWIDISGIPTHAICSTLNVCRSIYSNRNQNIIYTSAKEYYPSKLEYDELKKKAKTGKVEFLPITMAREMSEVLMLEAFSGHRSKEGKSCLAVFAGYEVHRSAGVIESINPSLLLLLYGKPGNASLEWRLDLSTELHNRIEANRKSARELISTLDYREAIEILEKYYEYLFEDYDFTVSPVCSKMQVVGTFLFWERYREVQIVFPLPIGYSVDKSPKGISKTYSTTLLPRNTLYHIITPDSAD